MYAAFESNSFEESIRLVFSFGGDTDTNACIVGNVAETLYGIDQKLIKNAMEYILKEFVKKLNLAYKIKKV